MRLRFIKILLKNPECLLQRELPGSLIPDKLAVGALYKKRFGKKLDLNNPETFNEKVLWLALNDRNPQYTTMVDKHRAKAYIKEKIGEDLTPRTIRTYKSTREINLDDLPAKFVLKCNHDSGSVVVCNNRRPTDQELRLLDKALKRNYFWFSREWPYKNIAPLVFAEEYIDGPSDENGGLVDYKLYCMNGKPYMFCVISNRSKKAKLTFFDLYWEKIPVRQRYDNHITVPKKPHNYERMIEIAKKLSNGIPFLRVDYFEDVNHKLYIGELTFTPSSGLIPFEPESFDYELGKMLDIKGISRV